MLRKVVRYILLSALPLVVCADAVMAQVDFEAAPIEYGARKATDRVAKLGTEIAAGKRVLKRDEKSGLLPALLEALEISPESQTLVFSKTSFQLHKISPETPRAIYFNDDTYVGWVRDSELFELGATDKDQGAVFYTMEPSRTDMPEIIRDTGQCLICHGTIRTQGVPGFLIRSVYCNPAGRFVSGTPTYVTDHSSPFSQRWGGWYVTGSHGNMPHLGNVTCRDKNLPGWIDPDEGINRMTLPKPISDEDYLRPTSDLVALMVMEHQTQMQNIITRASFEARLAAHHDTRLRKELDRPLDQPSESSAQRIAEIGERLLRYLFMADEFELTSPVKGASAFAEQFSQRGPRDSAGRSLYQLDLKRRLFRYPCSYLIYSEPFEALPETVKSYVGKRIDELLFADSPEPSFEHLTLSVRAELSSILSETKTEFWKTYVTSRR